MSADWVIARSGGDAGVVLFTDDSIPFARNKSDLIKRQLATCPGVTLLATENVPIPDASQRTPREVSSLMSRFRGRWTHSVAINDLYFADAAPALQAAGRPGEGPPFNIGAGDGDPSAFQRINNGASRPPPSPNRWPSRGGRSSTSSTAPSPHGPASGYVAPAHVVTAENSGGATSWDPRGYQEAYRSIWQG